MIRNILWVAAFFILLLVWLYSAMQPVQPEWSSPAVFYAYPDTSHVRDFQAIVHDEVIHVVKRHFRMAGEDLEFSEIFLMVQQPGTEPDLQQITNNEYPADIPSVFRTQSGEIHLFWGERRKDPGFEFRDNLGHIGLGNFSTAITHVSMQGGDITNHEVIYEGELGIGGLRSVLLPVRVTEDIAANNHVVFQADSIFTVTPPSGEEFTSFLGRVASVRLEPAGHWSPVRFFADLFSFMPDIAALPAGDLVVAYLGVGDHGMPTENDVLMRVSEDGGATWGDPQLRFLSGDDAAWVVHPRIAPDGILHLVWGNGSRQNLPGAIDIMRHSFSKDGGKTWSDPVLFFELEPSDTFIGGFIRTEVVTDSYGQVHWVGKSLKIRAGGESENDLYYASWNPLTESWQEAGRLDFAVNPLQFSLALDESRQELYVFWDEEVEFGVFPSALHYSVKRIEEPVPPEVITESGPLKLHANAPNPFKTTTTIPFTLEEPGEVNLRVFDVNGRRVYLQNMGSLPEGFHSYPLALPNLASGIFIYELELNGRHRQQETMTLIR